MNHPGQLLVASLALLDVAGCATVPPVTGPALEAASATLEDYRQGEPFPPALVAEVGPSFVYFAHFRMQ